MAFMCDQKIIKKIYTLSKFLKLYRCLLKYVHQADDLTHFTSLPMRERQTCMTELWPTYIFLSQKSQGQRFAKYLSWTVKKENITNNATKT